MPKVSKAQLRVLRSIGPRGRKTPKQAGATLPTWIALARAKLIHVDTSFANIARPRTAAWAVLTDEGRRALAQVALGDF